MNQATCKTIYQEKGFSTRKDYLESLVDKYLITHITVFTLAEMLGPEEDFDGLINILKEVEGEDL